MKQFFASYIDWEDYQNGMYADDLPENKDELFNKAIDLLSNPCLFYESAKEMVKNWPISSEHNLTNSNMNRKAWIGQAACCYKFGIPEIITKEAWKNMQDSQRIEANAVANSIINEYEINYYSIRGKVESKRIS